MTDKRDTALRVCAEAPETENTNDDDRVQQAAAQRENPAGAGVGDAMRSHARSATKEIDLLRILEDAWEIRGACGFMWMRMAVAADAQDAFDVGKREFTEHEAAFQRLETALPAAIASLRAAALAPSPDTGLPVQTFTDTEIAAVDRALQIESLSLELRGKVIQTIALSGQRGDHAEPAPSPDTGTPTHETNTTKETP